MNELFTGAGRGGMKIYIAGPFFNRPQREHMNEVEETVRSMGYNMHSPRIHSGTLSPSSSPEQVQRVFGNNRAALESCNLVIAVADFLLEPGKTLRLMNPEGHAEPAVISLPDTGTVWECGFATALKVPVLGYYRQMPMRINVMLAKSMQGLVFGHAVLMDFLNADCDWSKTIAWKGVVQ